MTTRTIAAGAALVALAACQTTPERPSPRPAPQPVAEARAQPEPAPASAMATPLSCLATAIYHEARGEGDEAMRAVGAVVMNRVKAPGFPSDVCAVIKQGSETGSCQFSWWCDGRPDEPTEPEAFEKAEAVAKAVLAGAPDPTNGATYFHNIGATPSWANAFRRTATIGQHAFYAE
ncbi:cell wall hydrolase [Parvularcula dongshanensis]|uniref:Spore germination cell wall hydrolase CwlJ-like protein n=1 Tax=Parvularcula dongshanensis TaxID=1173995 RepID=A0A840I7K3_9PROT|nr:cell wall hydrolase [Parvularcula dongshanensis]MBB4660154.1 spore germination cell wall hydrolase CwlJ-like protein [Parvularcula dongshanensis]